MEFTARPPAGGLVVLLDDAKPRHLSARPAHPFRFGRSRAAWNDLTIGARDGYVSRLAGSVHWEDGLWTVQNDSTRHAFYVVVGHDEYTLPCATDGSVSTWPIGHREVSVKIVTPTATYLLGLRPVDGDARALSSPDLDSREPDTNQMRSATPHQRFLLGAKFLGRSRPGDAIGNAKAAERANPVRCGREPGLSPVTGKAVEDCVTLWRDELRKRGVTGISGQRGIDKLGRQLLAWGVISHEDRLPLPPVHDTDI